MDKALIDKVDSILSRIQFEIALLPPYQVKAKEGHGGVYIQAKYMDEDIYLKDGILREQFTRKWLVSPQMTDLEIVQTVFKMFITSFEHRVREAFKYKGVRIFGPHFDVDDLVKPCHDGREDG